MLLGEATQAASNGLCALHGLGVDLVGNFILTAQISALDSGQAIVSDSAPFTVVVGEAYQLFYLNDPASCKGGDKCMFQPVVLAQDRGRNTVPTYDGLVTFSLGENAQHGRVHRDFLRRWRGRPFQTVLPENDDVPDAPLDLTRLGPTFCWPTVAAETRSSWRRKQSSKMSLAHHTTSRSTQPFQGVAVAKLRLAACV